MYLLGGLMKGLTAFARTVTTVNVWVAKIFNWVVVLLFLLLLWDAIMRYVADSPIEWSQQLSRLLFGVYLIIGGFYLWILIAFLLVLRSRDVLVRVERFVIAAHVYEPHSDEQFFEGVEYVLFE